VLRLTLPAPDIVEGILDGRQPEGMTLPGLMDPFPEEWSMSAKQLWLAESAPAAAPTGREERITLFATQPRRLAHAGRNYGAIIRARGDYWSDSSRRFPRWCLPMMVSAGAVQRKGFGSALRASR
jgi:hypothetical protein